MERAKLFKNGQSQAVRLPKHLRFEGTEVFARKLGTAVILLPVNDPWGSLRQALGGFSDDFLSERAEPAVQDREGLD
ncbi:MAG TPA: type II toxin-antitoxin system VapB family antitoxin [Polyangiaceae bacterium]|jgi:antitoxin VapB|nr:type II toxin-antitoxin system VapB family antitoxin [Polyangiaceae bacterium]